MFGRGFESLRLHFLKYIPQFMKQLLLLIIIKALILIHPNAFNKDQTHSSDEQHHQIKVTTVSCYDQAENIISKSANELEEIEKIRTEYAKIENRKNGFTKYTKLAVGERILIPSSLGDQLSFIYDNHSEIKKNTSIEPFELSRSKGGKTIDFYFDYDFDLRLIIINEFDNWDGFWSTTHSFYFAKNAKRPFFYYRDAKSYEYMDDPSSNNITEDRIYFKIDSTYEDESCPEIIRALTKKTKVFDGEDEAKSRASTPNTPMEMGALKALALKILNDEFETGLDKYNILFPVGSMK